MPRAYCHERLAASSLRPSSRHLGEFLSLAALVRIVAGATLLRCLRWPWNDLQLACAGPGLAGYFAACVAAVCSLGLRFPAGGFGSCPLPGRRFWELSTQCIVPLASRRRRPLLLHLGRSGSLYGLPSLFSRPLGAVTVAHIRQLVKPRPLLLHSPKQNTRGWSALCIWSGHLLSMA